MKKLLTTILFLLNLCSFAQGFSSRSVYEKRWALFHPFAAIKIKNIYKKCIPVYQSVKEKKLTDKYENGGKLDAFRHVYFMAAFAQKTKSKTVKKLGIAHEKGNFKSFLQKQNENGEIPDSLSSVMDLYNNTIGIEIGNTCRKKTPEELKEYVLNQISEGKVLYFKRNLNGDYLTCEGDIINLKKIEGKWFVPKCLIKSNQ